MASSRFAKRASRARCARSRLQLDSYGFRVEVFKASHFPSNVLSSVSNATRRTRLRIGSSRSLRLEAGIVSVVRTKQTATKSQDFSPHQIQDLDELNLKM